MLKTGLRFLLFLFIIALIIPLPVSCAEQYGLIHGHALDRNGNPISGVTITLLDKDYKTVSTLVTGSDGEFAFSHVPVPSGCDIYQLRATFSAAGVSRSTSTAYFNCLAMQTTTQDVVFYDYPPASAGVLHGVVSSFNNRVVPVPATVYLGNGMFTVYDGSIDGSWSFDLPVGEYVVWAERNENGVTYTSEKYNARVVGDEPNYLPIYLSQQKTTTFHQQPSPMKNVVHGAILQKNGMPCAGAVVELCRLAGDQPRPVWSATSNATGYYAFDGVNVKSISERYVVRASCETNGAVSTQLSQPFTIYYANTIGVPHDFDVPIRLSIVDSGSAFIESVPSGARISVDGVDTGKVTPYDVDGLKAGTHQVGLSLEGYFNDNFMLQVQPDARTPVNRSLKPNTGDLEFRVTPVDAKVYLDGQYVGTGSLNLSRKPYGEHAYLVVCDGYRNESGTVDIVPGETTARDIDMVAVPGFSLTYIVYLINNMLSAIGSIFSGGQ